MTSPEPFERYLSILGVEREAPSIDHLRRLVRAQLVRVPFENISKVYLKKTRGASSIPSLEEHLDGIEGFGFGGTCYANNPHFANLLRHCGYDVDLCGADMTRSDVHVASIVRLEGRDSYSDAATFMNVVVVERFFPDRSVRIHNFTVTESTPGRATTTQLGGRNDLVDAIVHQCGFPADIVREAIADIALEADIYS